MGPLTRQTTIAIEQSRYPPSLEVAFQMARVFRVPLDDVFGYPDTEEARPSASTAGSASRTAG